MRSLVIAVLLVIPSTSVAQQFFDEQRTPPDTTPGKGLLNLGFNHTGLSFGNSARWTGLRINIRDRGVQRINGINLTIWKAARDANRHAVINGLAVGIVGPEGGTLSGVNLGAVGVIAYQQMRGINVGGLGLVSNGPISGINVGGLGVVADGKVAGLTIGGLGSWPTAE